MFAGLIKTKYLPLVLGASLLLLLGGTTSAAVWAGGDNYGLDNMVAFLVDSSDGFGLPPAASWTVEIDQAGAALGTTAAGIGDVNGDGYRDAAFCAPGYDTPGLTDRGAVLIYFGSEIGLGEQPDQTILGQQAYQFLCSDQSLSSAGDVNGDGYDDLVVGTHTFDGAFTDQGKAYLYLGSAQGLNLKPAWTFVGEHTYAKLGRGVSGAGDVNGDGFDDVIVGAYYYGADKTSNGRAYAFYGSATGLRTDGRADWLVEFKNHPNIRTFGGHLTEAGDVNADGYDDVLIASPEYIGDDGREGAALLYLGSENGLETAYSWLQEGNNSGHPFGYPMDSAGDVNHDGFDDVVIGQSEYSGAYYLQGRTYLFYGCAPAASDPTCIGGLRATPWFVDGAAARTRLGMGASGAGDVNHDGYDDLLVGAFGFPNDSFRGAAYVYYGSNLGLGRDAAWSIIGDQDGSYMGLSVARAGDLNADGLVDILIGAPGYDGPLLDQGRAIAFYGVYPCPEVVGNLIENYCFEDGPGPWTFWTDGAGGYTTSTIDPYQGQFAAEVAIQTQGGNVQLYQKDIALKPNALYEISFAAYSSNGRNLSVFLHKHGTPYTNYGLNNFQVDLTTGWQVYNTTFTTSGFATPVNDARLRFWLAPFDQNNMSYRIDWVVLREVDAGNPPIPPDPPVIVPPPGQCNPPVPGNLIGNPGFETGTSPWTFWSDGQGVYTTDNSDPYECANNAKVSINQQGSNVQLYQQPLTLQGGVEYQLRLAARSSGGQDAQLFVHKHGAPYTNYGLNGVTLDLTPAWQVFVVDFTAVGAVPLTDARLRLWLAPFDQNGMTYEFDDVVLIPKSAVPPVAQISEYKLDGPQAALRTPNWRNGVAASAVLRQGYFLDGNEDGRLAGGYVPENGASLCYNARPSRADLFPATGSLMKVHIFGIGSPRNVVIDAITQDEAVGPTPDGYGVGTSSATLRRERDDSGAGRVYHIAFTATDQGQTCSHEVVVTVPLDRRTPAEDTGSVYDSTVAAR